MSLHEFSISNDTQTSSNSVGFFFHLFNRYQEILKFLMNCNKTIVATKFDVDKLVKHYYMPDLLTNLFNTKHLDYLLTVQYTLLQFSTSVRLFSNSGRFPIELPFQFRYTKRNSERQGQKGARTHGTIKSRTVVGSGYLEKR